MTLLPIVARELRVAARRPGIYNSRTMFALGIVLASAAVFFSLKAESQQTLGKTLFGVVSGGVLLYCALAGVLLTADCLSEEKREGTLGLLFLTSLTGFDVVLGKLASTSINASYSVLGLMPVLALPLLLGGVAGGELSRLALVFMNTLFLSLTAGLFVSSVSLHARKAMNAALGLMLFLGVGAPTLGAWLDYLLEETGKFEAMAMISPACSFSFAFAARYQTGTAKFWVSALLVHLLAWLFLIVASMTARRTWQDRPKDFTTGSWRVIWRSWLLGSATTRKAFREWALEINPFLWRAGREIWKPRAVWLGMGSVGLFWLGATFEFGSGWIGPPSYLITGWLLMVGLKLGIATEAGIAFGQDRRSGALELVLATPVSEGEIIKGQLLALKRQFFVPACATLGLSLLFLLFALTDRDWHLAADERRLLTTLFVTVVPVFVADSVALAVVGMWQGLIQRKQGRAASNTVGRVLVLPWLAYSLASLWVTIHSSSPPDWWFFVGLWLLFSLAVDCGFGVWAWRKLQADFRRIAVDRAAPRPPWWWRIFGG